nr:unnamed protein product [Callosobruchus analis]
MDAPIKKKRKQWSAENMRRAILAVRAKEMGLKRASNHFGVPKSTLKDKVNSKVKDIDQLVHSRLGRKPVLGDELENILISYCLEMEKRFYGLRTKDVKKMAFLLAEGNGLPHPFTEKNHSAGWKWLRCFMKRHPQLSFRRPQPTSMGRIKRFKKDKVDEFFDIFEPLMEIIKHSPNKLYNCDETGLTIVQHKTSKVLALKGKRQVGALSSAERGSLVTVVTCMSAAGHYIPPLFVFPRVNMKAELLDGTPNGSIVSLPPHCTHKMQPLDKELMSPLKTYYAQAIETWLRQHSGRVITHYQVGKLFGEAYNQAATVATAANGFRVTGLFPCDRNVFQPHEFISDLENADQGHNSSIIQIPACDGQPLESDEPQPCCSMSNCTSHSSFVLPTDISPLPLTTKQGIRPTKGRKAGRGALLTSLPYKDNLANELNKMKKTNGEGMKQKQKSLKKVARKCFGNKENGLQSNTEKSTESASQKLKGRKKRPERKKKESGSSSDSDLDMDETMITVSTDEEDSESDCECPYCNETYLSDRKGEKWIACIKCKIWCHEACSGTDDYKKFICDFCL